MCMKSNLTACLLFIGIFFSLHSCMKEDFSKCGLYIRFKYTNNPDHTDKFAEEIKDVDLFIFDDNGIFVGKWEHSALSGNEMKLSLENGTYTMVAWANLSEHFTYTQFVAGTTTFDEAVLSLQRDADQTVSVHPAPIYHSIVSDFYVKRLGLQTCEMDLSHVVNHLQVDLEGLPIEENPSMKALSPADNTRFAVEVTGNNADFSFDYTRKDDAPFVHYTPNYWQTGRILHAGFTLMKLEPGDATVIRVFHLEGDGSWKTLYEASLTDLITQNPSMDFTLNSEFTISLQFDYTYAVVEVKVNGWTAVEGDDGQGGVIG